MVHSGKMLGALLAFAVGPAAAQQQAALGQEEVRAHFQRMQQELSTMVNSGDGQRLTTLTRDMIADGADLAIGMEVEHRGERKATTMLTLRKEDLLGLRQFAANVMQAIEGYALEVEVLEVRPAGPGAATARVRFADRGTIRPPAMPAAALQPGAQATGADGAAPQQAGAAQGMRFERSITCSHLVQRGQQADELLIGLSNCLGRISLQ